MVKTLSEDEFETGVTYNIDVDSRDIHNIVYGYKNWTDAIDSATLELLVDVGVVQFVKAIKGESFETHIYESVKGFVPEGGSQ